MRQSRSLTSLVTGASVALITFTSFVLVVMFRGPMLAGLAPTVQIWILILTTSTATLLVMSLLHGDLNRMYEKLSQSEAQAHEDARRDSLTGLGNRKFLLEHLDSRLAGQMVEPVSALLLLDLDHFKRVNDVLGHVAGDELITKLAKRLQGCAPDCVLARLGGDEFALIVECPSPEVLSDRCAEICNALAGAYIVTGSEVHIGVSLGAALLESELDAPGVLRRADIAMYQAKIDRAGYRIFDQVMLQRIERRALVESRLRVALASGLGLSVVYQEQVARTGEVVALEALLRWNDEQLGQVSPSEAIAVAEDACLIEEVGLFIANEACTAAYAFPGRKVCINLAVVQLLNLSFAGVLEKVVRQRGVEPSQIQLEVSERVFVERGDEIEPTLRSLARCGFELVADNFGTSISSLTHLQRLQISTVKLDRSLLESTRAFGNLAVMRAKVALAKSLGIKVVCAGVADVHDEAIGRQSGCDLFQGYYYSEPLPLKALIMKSAAVRDKRAAQ